MPAIVRNLVVAGIAAAVLAFASAQSEIMDLLGDMTASLADDNAAGFMSGFDKSMPQYGALSGYMDALVGEAEITCNIELIKSAGDDSKRSADLDWTLHIHSREAAGPTIQREQAVHIELVKRKKRWKIVAIGPLDFFAPAKFDASK